jgi:predicted O-methyltransferase YrrM
MDEYRFYRALREGRPYFGPKMAAPQGPARRKAYMQALVSSVARERPHSPIHILEIGSWAGASTVAWARAVQRHPCGGRVVCVDHWQNYFDLAVNADPVYREMSAAVDGDAIYRLFRHNIRTSGVGQYVVEMRGSSREILPRLAPESFHIVFIDGSHLYREVLEDIRNATALVGEGGLVCGDDLDLQASECDEAFLNSACAEARDYCQDPRTGTCFHPGVTRAVDELFGTVTAFEGLWVVRKTLSAWTRVDVDPRTVVIPDHLSVDHREDPVEPLTGLSVGDYNLVRIGDRILAVWRGLGDIDLLHEPVGVRDWPPYVLLGASVQDVAVRAKALTEAGHQPEVEFVAEVDGYNLLRAGDKVYALAQTLGPVALFRERFGEREMPPDLLIGRSEESVSSQIRALAKRHAAALAQERSLAELER